MNVVYRFYVYQIVALYILKNNLSDSLEIHRYFRYIRN